MGSTVASLGRALVALGASACAGCTIVGATIGSSIPKHEPLPEERTANVAAEGQPIEVETAKSERLSGEYGGAYDDRFWVETPGGRRDLASTDVRDAKVSRDDYFLEGLLVGLAVDLAVIAVIGAEADHLFPDPQGRHVHVGADGVDVAAH